MSQWIQQSTAVTIKLGPFVDSVDGVTPKTSLTIAKADVRLSKNGGDMGAAHADQGAGNIGAPHDELGYYNVALDATDTGTLGRLQIMVSAAGALPVHETLMVLPANVYDSMVLGGATWAAGSGELDFPYTLISSVDSAPIADALVWVTSDEAGENVIASGRTDQAGLVTFHLDAGTVYVWRKKSGWDFVNPDEEEVTA